VDVQVSTMDGIDAATDEGLVGAHHQETAWLVRFRAVATNTPPEAIGPIGPCCTSPDSTVGCVEISVTLLDVLRPASASV
jgi:hypothetical protein